MTEQAIVPGDVTATVSMKYGVTGFEPLTKMYGSSRFVPESVRINVTNGEITTVIVAGGKLLANGGASEKVWYDNRYWWDSANDREKAPAWLQALAQTALQAVVEAGLVP